MKLEKIEAIESASVESEALEVAVPGVEFEAPKVSAPEFESSNLLERESTTLFSLPYLYSTKKEYLNNLVIHLCCAGVPTLYSRRNLRLR